MTYNDEHTENAYNLFELLKLFHAFFVEAEYPHGEFRTSLNIQKETTDSILTISTHGSSTSGNYYRTRMLVVMKVGDNKFLVKKCNGYYSY